MNVSIVAEDYKSSNVIRKCILSALEQTHSDIEHIFVDASSTDGTVDVINNLAPRANLISGTDFGIYDAFNMGLCRTTVGIVFF